MYLFYNIFQEEMCQFLKRAGEKNLCAVFLLSLLLFLIRMEKKMLKLNKLLIIFSMI